jgi:hypothetical protein
LKPYALLFKSHELFTEAEEEEWELTVVKFVKFCNLLYCFLKVMKNSKRQRMRRNVE